MSVIVVPETLVLKLVTASGRVNIPLVSTERLVNGIGDLFFWLLFDTAK